MTSDSQSENAIGGSAGAHGSATGWWNPTPYSNRRRVIFHYVAEDGRTLCRKWGYVGLGTLEDGNDDHADNCAECKKKKLAMNAKNAKSPNAEIRRPGPDAPESNPRRQPGSPASNG